MSYISKRNPEFARDAAYLERKWGIIPALALDYMPDDLDMAMDAQPTLQTQPDSAIPAFFTQFVSPEVIRVLQAPNKGALILGEKKMGSWVDQTAIFPVIENTGEVSSYGDFNYNGKSGANPNFVERQAYLFQTHIEYGDLEVERAGAARLNWISELQIAAAKTLDKFMDYVYHFGVTGLKNYGILNDPQLSAALTPGTKGYGGVKWVNNGIVVATANEIYTDFQSLYGELSVQSGGIISEDDRFVLIVPNTVNVALTAANSFGVTIRQLIKESFPNVEIVVDPRYATTGGNVVQLIAKTYDGSDTGYCAFNEKMRDHRVVPDTSSFRQKKTAGAWGAILTRPMAVGQMIGV